MAYPIFVVVVLCVAAAVRYASEGMGFWGVRLPAVCKVAGAAGTSKEMRGRCKSGSAQHPVQQLLLCSRAVRLECRKALLPATVDDATAYSPLLQGDCTLCACQGPEQAQNHHTHEV